ncbi:MAG TPA: hypothetical protein DET40_11400 [Lentisphaeria bacterium]|nr:MAG: hypothetical protein A2X45_19790 [Lentisphaerae bacterium GWF2_50_93]HCE44145.1 hypothetical protein [Lentisphaeria bacterium]
MKSSSTDLKVSVIIPSFDGKRNGNVEMLKEQLGNQTQAPFEIIVVVGVSPNGKARNEGVKKASGNFYVFIDDDVTLGNDKVIENLLRPFLERKDVGMTGPSQLIPDNSNWFQKTSAKQVPRSLFPIQKELVDSDMVSHMCLCMPEKLFKDIGWENPDIIAGTDPDLRHRVRQSGLRVCVAPDTWAYHPMPETFSKLMRLAYAKGRNSATVRFRNPELILELNDGFSKEFAPRRGFLFRIFRTGFNMLKALVTFKIIGFAYLFSYYLGNTAQSLKHMPRN